MKIYDIKVNGYNKPIGYELNDLVVSWKVKESKGTESVLEKIEVSKQKDFSEVIYTREDKLNNVGTKIEVDLDPRTRYYIRITVNTNKDEIESSVSYFETGKMNEVWEGKWIGPESNYHPVIIKRFKTNKLNNPRLYITGLGLYEAKINGKKIGNEYLTPGFSDYDVEVQVNTYDLSDMMKEDNILEISLANGWYKGIFGIDKEENVWGSQFGTLFEIWDEDTLIARSDETANVAYSGIISSGIYNGVNIENVDHYEEKPVTLLEPLSHPVDRFNLPITEVESFDFQDIISTPAGETVLDFGQNMGGILRIKDKQSKGTKLKFHFGEVLQNGNFFNENYRDAAYPFVYESRGNYETIESIHTFFGFRYVKVEGWEDTIDLGDIQAVAISSDLPRTGYFKSSHEKVNKLYENTLWSQRSNFIDIPTDCPQRDERIAWTGDAQVFSGTASFNMDTKVFFRKFLRHLRYEQNKLDGGVPNYIPNIGSLTGATTVWGDAASIIPETVFNQYGDVEELRNHYSIIKDWSDYLIRWDKKDGNQGLIKSGMHFGDWLGLDGVSENSFKGGTDDFYLASVYYLNTLEIMTKTALLLDYMDDYNYYQEQAKKVRESIMNEYFSPNGRLTVDTQTAYIVALKFELYTDKQKLINQFINRLERDSYKMKSGFVGATQYCLVLSQNGMEDIALQTLLSESYPGWLHTINLGATTIWERWNSLDEEGVVSPTGMNSFNHYSYGSVVEYLYRELGGLNESSSGFKTALIAPKITGLIPHVAVKYESVHGEYCVEYDILDTGEITVQIKVPFGCEAVLKLPAWEEEERLLKTGDYTIVYTPTVDFRKIFNKDSKVIDLKHSEEAMKILEKDLPIAYYQIMNNDLEWVVKTLDEYKYLQFLGVAVDQVERVIEKVSKITV